MRCTVLVRFVQLSSDVSMVLCKAWGVLYGLRSQEGFQILSKQRANMPLRLKADEHYIVYLVYLHISRWKKATKQHVLLEFQQLWIVARIPKESPVWRGQGRSWTPELLQLGSFGGLPPLRRYSLGGEILAPGMVGWRRGKGIEHALNAFATKNGRKKAWCLHRAENQTLQWPTVKKQSWWEGYSILQCTSESFIFDHLTNFQFHGRLPQKPCANSRTMFWWRRMALRTSRWLRGPLRLALKSCFFLQDHGM